MMEMSRILRMIIERLWIKVKVLYKDVLSMIVMDGSLILSSLIILKSQRMYFTTLKNVMFK